MILPKARFFVSLLQISRHLKIRINHLKASGAGGRWTRGSPGISGNFSLMENHKIVNNAQTIETMINISTKSESFEF
jgi:hypothetical protein